MLNVSKVTETESNYRQINICLGNGLVPPGKKPSPQPMLTQIYDVTRFHLAVAHWAYPHWSPTVPVSVWLPEPARDRGSKQETLNGDFYHTTNILF